MRTIVGAIEREYRRYKALGEGAIGQLDDAGVNARPSDLENSVAIIAWHLSGNLASRFSDFLTDDGEKPWRQREEEFAARTVTRDELLAKWNGGWQILGDTLASLTDADLSRTVTIRGVGLGVHEALLRSLAHVSYHVGQIVFLAKGLRGGQWRYLSIPPGGSDAYNLDPRMERPDAHTDALTRNRPSR